MSDSDSLTLKYKDIEKKIPLPKSYEILKSYFIKEFNEDEKNNFIFSYLDEDNDDIIIDEHNNEFEIRQAIGFIINVKLDDNLSLRKSTTDSNINFSEIFGTKEKEKTNDKKEEEPSLNDSNKVNNSNSNDAKLKKQIDDIYNSKKELIKEINELKKKKKEKQKKNGINTSKKIISFIK